MSPFRPALVAAVVMCAGLVTACDSGGKGAEKPSSTPTTTGPATGPSSGPPASTASPASAACPTRAELVQALRLGDASKVNLDMKHLVCQDGWATLPMLYSGADPARVVVRRVHGTVRLVTYGTDALCENKQVKKAPVQIKKGLGDYC